MIELISICQNNPYMLGVVLLIMLFAILLTMYIMQAIKDIVAIPTPSASWMILISFALAGGITEIGVYAIVHFYSGIGILGALAEAALYTYYKGIYPEQQFLAWIVKVTAGRVTALVEKPSSSNGATTVGGVVSTIAQADYENK